MSIADQITRIKNAKADIKSAIQNKLGQTVPASAKLDTYYRYVVPPGVYITAPTSVGVYIKYTDGTYSDYNKVISGKTPLGVSLKTSACAFTIYPNAYPSSGTLSFMTSYNAVPGCTVVNEWDEGELDYAGKANTQAIINSGYGGTAFTGLSSLFWADNYTGGWIVSAGQLKQMIVNGININTALTNIGGVQIDSRGNMKTTTLKGSYYLMMPYTININKSSVSWTDDLRQTNGTYIVARDF